MSKTDEYKVPDSVKNDDVAMWSSEEDLLIYSHFYDKGRAEALNSQWVKCSERMPELGEKVLICMIGGLSGEPLMKVDYTFRYHSNPVEWKYTSDPNIVTHWQPLPSPPLKP